MSDVNSAKGPGSTEPEEPRHRSPERAQRPGRAAVRRRLLDAALSVFADRGYADAHLDEVAAAAGLTKGAIYSNFASKDDIFFAMVDDQVLNRVADVRTALAASSAGAHGRMTPHDVGRLLTTAFTEQREWQLVFLDFWLRAVRDDQVREQFHAHRAQLRAAMAGTVQQFVGQAPAGSGLDVDEAVTVILALCNGLVIEKYIDPGAVSDDLLGRILEQLSPS